MKKPGVFYGYWILAVCCLFCTVSTGSGLIAFSFFIKPVEADIGWSRTQIMAGFTILLIFIAVISPFAGRLVDRYGARLVMFLGAVLESGGFILLSQMNSLWQYYVGYAIVGVGIAAIAPITTSLVVSQWFSQKRGKAIGIMAMGIGLGGVVYAPFTGVYLIPNFGWSNAYLAIGICVGALIIPLTLLVIRTRPADMGLFPDGAETPPVTNITKASTLASEGLSLKMALATPAFWLIAVSFFLQNSHLGVAQNQVPYLGDIGFSVGIAASAVSIVAGTSVLSQFFFGWLCDKIPAKSATAISLSITTLGILILLNVKSMSPVWMIWVYSAVFGSGAGSWMPLMSMLTSTTFGLSSYGAIFGMLSLFQNLGAGTSPLIVGYMYDAMGTYHWAFILILALVVVGIPVVLAIRRPVIPQNPSRPPR